MDHYERSKLADAIREEKFEPEDFIIKEVTIHDSVISTFFRETQETYST